MPFNFRKRQKYHRLNTLNGKTLVDNVEWEQREIEREQESTTIKAFFIPILI